MSIDLFCSFCNETKQYMSIAHLWKCMACGGYQDKKEVLRKALMDEQYSYHTKLIEVLKMSKEEIKQHGFNDMTEALSAIMIQSARNQQEIIKPYREEEEEEEGQNENL